MKKTILIFLLLLCIMIPKNVFAFNDTSRSSIVMDIDSGRILYQKNANEKRLVASITKIMTATIALEKGNLNDVFVAGDEVLKMYGTNIYLEKGEEMKLQDLLYGLLLRSGNDAAVVIANNICSNEKEFVKLMNKKALEIGMTGTTYMNSHGLDEETKNYSTAHDMALLSSYIYRTSKEYRKITKTYKYEVQSNNKSYLWYNRNKFLKQYDYATGGKNGYTPSAGKTLVTTAEKYGLRLTAVTLKDANQYETHANLYDYLFEKYKGYTIVDKNNFEIKNNFYKDNLYLKKSFKYPLMEEEKSKIKTIVELNKIKNYKNGTKVGVVNILLDNDKIGSVSVYIKKKAQKKKKFLFSS